MLQRGPSNPPTRQRGIALIGVVGMLLVFLVFVGALVVQLNQEVKSAGTSTVSNRALSAADAGVQSMVEQIEAALQSNQAAPGSITYTFPEPGASPQTTSYSVTATPYPGQGVTYYYINSTGTVDIPVQTPLSHEVISRKVTAIAYTQTISDFASFSNYETNQHGQIVWYLPKEYFNGPVYSGGPMRIMYAGTDTSTAPPIFGVNVLTANDPVWNPDAPNAGNEWNSVVNGGAGNFVVNKNGLGLPQPSKNLDVASQAWAGNNSGSAEFPNGMPPAPASSPAPVPPGVYIDGSASKGADAANSTQSNVNTGIFVNVVDPSKPFPNVYTATITSTVSGNTDTMKITSNAPGFGSYTVTINYTNNFAGTGHCDGTTMVSHTVGGNTTSHIFNGTPCGEQGAGVTNTGNGAIFIDGNVQLGNGVTPDTTLEGQFTFATPDYQYEAKNRPNDNDMTLVGSVLYDQNSAAFDKVGLWANNVILNTHTTQGLTIDASIIAGWPGEPATNGALYNALCLNAHNTCIPAGVQGTLNITGGLIENERGAVGENVNGTYYGFVRTINYDPRFANAPPPFNPTTGKLLIIAWQDD